MRSMGRQPQSPSPPLSHRERYLLAVGLTVLVGLMLRLHMHFSGRLIFSTRSSACMWERQSGSYPSSASPTIPFSTSCVWRYGGGGGHSSGHPLLWQDFGPEDMMRHILGEDLNVGCVLSWGPCWYTRRHGRDGHPSTNCELQDGPSVRVENQVERWVSHRGFLCVLHHVQGTKLELRPT